MAEAVGVVGGIDCEIGVEEAPGDDQHGEVHHLIVQVKGLPVGPGGKGAVGVIGHDAGVGFDALAVKGGLDQAALALVELVLARQQPLAHNGLERLQAEALVVGAVVIDQDVLDVVGVGGEPGDGVDEAQTRDSRNRSRVLHHAERVLAELLQVAPQPVAGRAGGRCRFRDGVCLDCHLGVSNRPMGGAHHSRVRGTTAPDG